jgi:hypothetical protein
MTGRAGKQGVMEPKHSPAAAAGQEKGQVQRTLGHHLGGGAQWRGMEGRRSAVHEVWVWGGGREQKGRWLCVISSL